MEFSGFRVERRNNERRSNPSSGPAGGPADARQWLENVNVTGLYEMWSTNCTGLEWCWRALSVATLGLEVANGKPWTEVKKMMIDEFCPIEEVQRLEDELRHLKLRDTNIAAYTERFNELALLCPDAVPNEKKDVV
ncbi:putative reverse transcriptase domain-containing protein [Tanacetum coccineum]